VNRAGRATQRRVGHRVLPGLILGRAGQQRGVNYEQRAQSGLGRVVGYDRAIDASDTAGGMRSMVAACSSPARKWVGVEDSSTFPASQTRVAPGGAGL
jgi:hypothetical protein